MSEWKPQENTFGIPRLEELTEDEVGRARLAVCGRARDVADARLLLDMLGLGGAS